MMSQQTPSSKDEKKDRRAQLDQSRSNPGNKINVNEMYVNLAKDQVTIVIPTLDEAEGIENVLAEVEKEGYKHVLVVEGYSKDETAEKAHQNGVRVVYQHGPGKAGAIRTAIDRVETPYMLFMDGDCTYDPKDIWRLLNHATHYAHVIGARDKRNIPRLHRIGNWVISKTFSILFGVNLSDVCSGMYLLETEEARKYKLQEPGFMVEIELAACSAANEEVTEVPISYRQRVGKGKLSAWNGFSILCAAFMLARRRNPILLYSSLAALLVIPGSIILGWVFLERLMAGVWHQTWGLLGAVVLLMGAQAITLASVSMLTRHSEDRLRHEIKSTKVGS